MREAVIFGDLSSDRTGEQYPTVFLCDACIAADAARKEDSQIVSVGAAVDGDDDECAWADNHG